MSFAVTVAHEIPDNRVIDLLTCALEGGSNYWYFIPKYHHGKPHPDEKFREEWKGLMHSCPFEEGGWLKFVAFEGNARTGEGTKQEVNGKTEWLLNRETIQKGLNVMAEKYLRHFHDFLNENDDSDTGDVFLQCCLFGEVIFG